MSTATAGSSSASWYANYPTPSAILPEISVKELHDLLHCDLSASANQREFLVVDVRRTDIEGDMGIVIPGAINLPAQTFYSTLPVLVQVLNKYEKVIFHCSSSSGRGPRCAGWYQDELDRRGEKGSASYVLKGGIKAWTAEFKDEVVKI